MLERLIQKRNQRLNSHLPDPDDEFIGRVVDSKLKTHQYICTIPQPFLTYLHWSENFKDFVDQISLIVDEKDEVTIHHLENCEKEMSLCLDNFNKLIRKQSEKYIRDAKLGEINYIPDIETAVDRCLLKVSYEDKCYREWCKDTSERLSRVYFRLRIVIDDHVDEWPGLETVFQMCLMGYLEERMENLWNACLI